MVARRLAAVPSRWRRILALTCLAALAAPVADAVVPVPGIMTWSHDGTIYLRRDPNASTPAEVVSGELRDFSGLMASMGLGDELRRSPGTFQVDRIHSGRGGWIVYRQMIGEVPVHRGRLAVRADAEGRVRYVEWDVMDGVVEGNHTLPPREENFRAALPDGATVHDLAGVTRVFVRVGGVLRPLWMARVLWRTPTTGQQFESIMLDAAYRFVRRVPLTANAGPEIVVDPEFGTRHCDNCDVGDTGGELLPIDRTVVRNGVELGANTGRQTIELRAADGLNWTEDDLDLINPVIRREGEPPAMDSNGPVEEVNFVYDHLQVIYDGLIDLYQWRSFNDLYAPILVVIGNPRNTTYPSLYEPGNIIHLKNDPADRQSMMPDVLAHEFMHGVIYHSAQLDFDMTPGKTLSEAGAINESLADIFQAVLDARQESKRAGRDVLGPTTWAIAGIRQLDNPAASAAPGADHYSNLAGGCPAHRPDCTVHVNSAISTLAFVLLTQGGTHPTRTPYLRVDGIGWRAAGEIFFDLLDKRIAHPGETFVDLRQQTQQIAEARHGRTSEAFINLCKAWDVVGVPGTGQGGCDIVPDRVSSVTTAPGSCAGLNDVSWSAVPGATRYVATVVGSAADLGTGGPSYDGSATNFLYRGIHSSPKRVHVKACNASTCGPWSAAYAGVSNATCH